MLMLLSDEEQQLVVDALNTKQLKHVKKYQALREHVERHIAESVRDFDRNVKYVEAAQGMSRDGELEVDDGAVVSAGDDDGAYIQAWLWVTNEDAGLPSNDPDEQAEEDDDDKDKKPVKATQH